MPRRAPEPEAGANLGKDLPGRGCPGAPGEGPGHRWVVDRWTSNTRENWGPGGGAQVCVMEESQGSGGAMYQVLQAGSAGWSRELHRTELRLDVCSKCSRDHQGSEWKQGQDPETHSPRLIRKDGRLGGRLASATRSCYVSCAGFQLDLETENIRSLLVRAECTRPPARR